MTVALRPSSEIPDNAQPFGGATLLEALKKAAEGLGAASPADVSFGFDRSAYSLGADQVQVLAWTKPFPEELAAPREFLSKALGYLDLSGSFSGQVESDGKERDTYVLNVSVNGGRLNGRTQSALRRVLREIYGWNHDLRFGGGEKRSRGSKEDRLREDVRTAADQVLDGGEPVRLRPMNSYDRRLAHNIVKDIDGVTTRSVGDGRNRQVEIVPED